MKTMIVSLILKVTDLNLLNYNGFASSMIV